jgi:N utilization substance protein B
MGGRHRAREYALQMLYQAEASTTPIGEVVAQFWSDREVPEEVRSFAQRLAEGTLAARDRIDALLARNLEHWRLERLALVDRNVLRLAVYEFLYEPGTPPIVVIDEAIEVAKRFGGDESGQFVNGILDALRKHLAAGTEEDAPGSGSATPDGS